MKFIYKHGIFLMRVSTLGKYLDQPALVNNLKKTMPYAMVLGGAGFGLLETAKAKKGERGKKSIQTASVLGFTITSALIATRGLKINGKQFIRGLVEPSELNHEAIESVLQKVTGTKLETLVNKAKNGQFLRYKEVKELEDGLDGVYGKGKLAISRVIPDCEHNHGAHGHTHEHKNVHRHQHAEVPLKERKFVFARVAENEKTLEQNHLNVQNKCSCGHDHHNHDEHDHHGHSHGAFGELKDLSLLGLIPVLGGITGGVVGDLLTGENWKKKFPDKIKEGTYQYLNNIFLCNVGAGIAMVTMNALKVKNKAVRFSAMLGGVMGVGILAGNAIANFVGKNVINPIFDGNAQKPYGFKSMTKNLNSERHPEAVDLSLHIDDVASVGFLSGFKWIGPVLPALYSVSAYRAGIGYRNGGQETAAKS